MEISLNFCIAKAISQYRVNNRILKSGEILMRRFPIYNGKKIRITRETENFNSLRIKNGEKREKKNSLSYNLTKKEVNSERH